MDIATNSLKMLSNQSLAHKNHHPDPAGLAVVPDVQGISDRVKRTLQQFNIKTASKPIRTLASVSKKPKDHQLEKKIAGIV